MKTAVFLCQKRWNNHKKEKIFTIPEKLGITEEEWKKAMEYLDYLGDVYDEQEELRKAGENVIIDPLPDEHSLDIISRYMELMVKEIKSTAKMD